MAQDVALLPDPTIYDHFRFLLWTLLSLKPEGLAIHALRLLRRKARALPWCQAHLGLRPPGSPGRPRGSLSLDPRECARFVMAMDCGTLRKADMLRTLKKTPNPATYRWLDRRLRYGRLLCAGSLEDELGDLFIGRTPQDRRRWARALLLKSRK